MHWQITLLLPHFIIVCGTIAILTAVLVVLLFTFRRKRFRKEGIREYCDTTIDRLRDDKRQLRATIKQRDKTIKHQEKEIIKRDTKLETIEFALNRPFDDIVLFEKKKGA